MLVILASAFTEADYDAGYRYVLSLLQVEFLWLRDWTGWCRGGCFSSRLSGANLDPGSPTGSASWSHGKVIVHSPTGRPDLDRSRLPYRVVVSARLFYARR
jgi:hypothetical protein